MKKYNLKVNGNEYSVAIDSVDDKIATVSVNGTEFKVELEHSVLTSKTPTIVQKRVAPEAPAAASAPVAAPVAAPVSRPAAGAGVTGSINSPLPGVILEVCVKEGDSVKTGQKLMVLEAMKMENNIEAEGDGVVSKIAVSNGASVMEGDLLIVIG